MYWSKLQNAARFSVNRTSKPLILCNCWPPLLSKFKIYLSESRNIFVLIVKCMCPYCPYCYWVCICLNCKIYLSELLDVFVQSSKCNTRFSVNKTSKALILCTPLHCADQMQKLTTQLSGIHSSVVLNLLVFLHSILGVNQECAML